MRNLRPEQFNSRASKASDADSPQRLRASVEAVSHRQRRSTNPPRLKSSAGKGKPGQHTNNRPVITRPSNRLIPGWLPNETTAPTPCNSRKLHPTGATCAHPPTNTVRNTFPTSGTSGTSGTLETIRQKKPQNHSLNTTQTLFPHNTTPKPPSTPPKQLNQTPQNTDSQCVYGGKARHMPGLARTMERSASWNKT